jgi:hypothetical protein
MFGKREDITVRERPTDRSHFKFYSSFFVSSTLLLETTQHDCFMPSLSHLSLVSSLFFPFPWHFYVRLLGWIRRMNPSSFILSRSNRYT